ncbi:uncharacterized protein METZ01_LOCUS234647, partial [marine metagenome]
AMVTANSVISRIGMRCCLIDPPPRLRRRGTKHQAGNRHHTQGSTRITAPQSYRWLAEGSIWWLRLSGHARSSSLVRHDQRPAEEALVDSEQHRTLFAPFFFVEVIALVGTQFRFQVSAGRSECRAGRPKCIRDIFLGYNGQPSSLSEHFR